MMVEEITRIFFSAIDQKSEKMLYVKNIDDAQWPKCDDH